MDLIFQNMSLNKEWMKAPRNSIESLEGIESFFNFIKANKEELGDDDWYCYPCVKCRNLIRGKKTLSEIHTHLICHGIDKTYTTWIHHGELHLQSHVNLGASNNNEDAFQRMVAGIMSYDRSSSASASTVEGCSSHEST